MVHAQSARFKRKGNVHKNNSSWRRTLRWACVGVMLALARAQNPVYINNVAVPEAGGFFVSLQTFSDESDICQFTDYPLDQLTVVAGFCQREEDLTSYKIIVSEEEDCLVVMRQEFADSECSDMVSNETLSFQACLTDIAKGTPEDGLLWSADNSSWSTDDTLLAYEYSGCNSSDSSGAYVGYMRIVTVLDIQSNSSITELVAYPQSSVEISKVTNSSELCDAEGDPWASWISYTTGSPSWYTTESGDAIITCFNTPDADDTSLGWSMQVTCNQSSQSDIPISVSFYEYVGCNSNSVVASTENEVVLNGGCGGVVYTLTPGAYSSNTETNIYARCLWEASSLPGTESPTSASGDNFPTISTQAPTINNNPGNSKRAIYIAIIPVVLMLAGVAYVLISKKKKKNQKDGTDDDESNDLESRLPSGSKSSRRGKFQMLGYSMSLMRVKIPGELGPAVVHDNDELDNDSSEDEADDVVGKRTDGANNGLINSSELEFGRLIGKGGSGKVFEGKFRKSRVAIKEYLGGRTHSSFIREVNNLRRLKHPNIIRFYGAVDSDLHRLLVMEYAPNSLANIIEPRGLPSGQAPTAVALLQWAQELASGLAFLHSKGLIHFDVKPENVLLDEGWNVKLCDFGVSRSIDSVLRPPSTNDQEGGTPSYTAPEMLTGDRAQLSSKVDVYAFAIVFWQMFHHGEAPHPDQWSVIEVLTQVSMENYRPPIKPETPEPLQDIITSCWETNPEDRPSMAEVYEMLDEILGSRSIDIVKNASFSNKKPNFELGQQVYVFNQSLQSWLPDCPSKLTSNRLNRPSQTYKVLGTTTHEDNLILANN